ncbi:PQQ-binding-like beta-propeller repeat protein [Isoptericola sp. NPDC057559]|uniref:outer membrane protein assembly factor BamB family protein n=1 Tax=Isoptericola sp. NPDC057559 TaxID=3346168 RepID=UPI003692146C
MPPRFRRPEPMTTFELVPDDEREPDDLPGMPDPDDDRPRRLAALRDRAVTRWRRLSRRSRATIAASTAVVLLAATTAAVGPGVLDAHDQRQRADAVRGLPGAVDDLSEPVAPTWSLPGGSDLEAVLPDGVLVAGDGRGVTAVDAGTGETVWEHPLDGGGRCGTSPAFRTEMPVTVETVACVSDDASTVTVLDAVGAVVAERELDWDGLTPPDAAPGDRQAWPAAGGAVALLDTRTDGTSSVEWQEGDDPAAALRSLRAAGWHDPTLRLEDALTGEVRAEVTVVLSPEDLAGCGSVVEEAGESRLTPDAWVMTAPTYTVLSVCEVHRVLTTTGAEIEGDDVATSISSIAEGGYLVPGDTSTLLDADGTVRSTVDGWVLTPALDTEPGGPVLALRAGTDGDGTALVAVGEEDEALWAHPITMLTLPLARVGDTLVVVDETSVAGLDAATGEERWRLADLLSDSPEAGEYVTGTATDGTRLLLAIPSPTAQDAETGETRSGFRLVAVDLRDGTIAWESRADDHDLWGMYAVGGHLVTGGETVSGLG